MRNIFEMNSKYYLGHLTDDILGRTGTTLDWPKSICDFDLTSWNNYLIQPPAGWNWREHLVTDGNLVARNAVKPFALYYVDTCNLVVLSEALYASTRIFDGTLRGVEAKTITFGKKNLPYKLGSLSNKNILATIAFSEQNVFFRVDTANYDIHGTRVQRGQETFEQVPVPIDDDQTYSSYDDLRNARASLTTIFPKHLEFAGIEMPQMFSIGGDLYVTEHIVQLISQISRAGISFPYAPITVNFDS